MTARVPRVATWLLARFSSGPHGESIAGDLMEQYAAHPSRRRYWRQVLSAIRADVLTTVRDNKWRTAAAIVLGCVAYVAASVPASRLVLRSKLITQKWLSDIDPLLFHWTLLLQQTFIVAIFCVAIGWCVAKASRRSAPAAVSLLAMTVLIFEYGMIALFFVNGPEPARALSTAELVGPALFAFSRPAGILLGGLLGMRPGIEDVAAVP